MATVPCPTCDESFDNEHGMKVHHGRVHGPIDDPTEGEYPCPSCERAFDHELGVKTHHIRTHGESIADRLTKPCLECGDEFTVTRRAKYDQRRYCSTECVAAARTDRVTKTCPKCGGQFDAHRSNTHRRTYCSTECLFTAHSGDGHPNAVEWVALDCTHCGDTTHRPPSKAHVYEHEFCSRECADEWQRENAPRGQDHHHWRGGRSVYRAVVSQLHGPGWVSIVSEHKDTECYKCGSSVELLDLHHIVPVLSGGVNHPDLLMTLCRPCHLTVESFTRTIVTPLLVDY